MKTLNIRYPEMYDTWALQSCSGQELSEGKQESVIKGSQEKTEN